MLAEIGIMLTLLQWLHTIQSERADGEREVTIDGYLEWLRRHNHQELLDAILESRDAVTKLESFVETNHSELLVLGDQLLAAISDAHGHLAGEIKSIKTSLSNLPTKDEMQDMLAALSAKIQQEYVAKQQEVPSRDILRYRVLGNRLGEFKTQTHVVEVLDGKGEISLDRILMLHKAMFPDGFAWAGVIRTQSAVIAGTFGTAARVVDLVKSKVEISLAPPESIPKALAALCDQWNGQIHDVLSSSDSAKAAALANFHYEFSMIHPFLDGNGRASRLILDQQGSALHGQSLHLELDREKYYKAFQFGNLGSMEELTFLIGEAIGKAKQSLDAV